MAIVRRIIITTTIVVAAAAAVIIYCFVQWAALSPISLNILDYTALNVNLISQPYRSSYVKLSSI